MNDNISAVTVSEPVDGTKRRRPAARASRCGPVEVMTVDPRVMTTAKQMLNDCTRLVIVSATEVRVVNR